MSNQMIWEGIFSKPVHVEFTQKKTTSDAGLIIANAEIKRFDLCGRISDAIPDNRNQLFVIHRQKEQVQQRILQLVAGYADLNDAATLRKDPAFTTLVLEEKNQAFEKMKISKKKLKKMKKEKQTDLSSAPTLCRFENRFDRASVKKLVRLQVQLYLERNKKRFKEILDRGAPLEIAIDMDPTDLETHGQQSLAFYNGHYGHTAYLPLVIADGDNGDLIAAIPRPGNRHATWMLKAILMGLIKYILKTYPQAQFKIRADSGFQKESFFKFIEQHPQIQTATISIAFNRSLEKLTKNAVTEFNLAFEQNPDLNLLHFGEVGYRADSWSKYRRIIYQIAKTHYGATEIRYYMTLDLTSTPEQVKLDYNRRADAENRIKEWKTQSFAQRVSGETFMVNAFRMLISGFAFIVLQEIQKKLIHTPLEHSYVATIREKLIKVAGIFKESTRRILLILPESYPYQNIWRHLIAENCVT